MRRRAPEPIAIHCPLCKQPVLGHWVQGDDGWRECMLACGWVTCYACELQINEATGDVRSAGRFVYDA